MLETNSMIERSSDSSVSFKPWPILGGSPTLQYSVASSADPFARRDITLCNTAKFFINLFGSYF